MAHRFSSSASIRTNYFHPLPGTASTNLLFNDENGKIDRVIELIKKPLKIQGLFDT